MKAPKACLIHYIGDSIGIFDILITDYNLHAITHASGYRHTYLTCPGQYHHILLHSILRIYD